MSESYKRYSVTHNEVLESENRALRDMLLKFKSVNKTLLYFLIAALIIIAIQQMVLMNG
jgi:cell division protein FtsL